MHRPGQERVTVSVLFLRLRSGKKGAIMEKMIQEEGYMIRYVLTV